MKTIKQDHKSRPAWWPENPYPKNIFIGEIADYVKAIPDDRLRSKISGVLGRFFWNIAEKQIFDAIKKNSCKQDQKESKNA